jgi:hypothetical protein
MLFTSRYFFSAQSVSDFFDARFLKLLALGMKERGTVFLERLAREAGFVALVERSLMMDFWSLWGWLSLFESGRRGAALPSPYPALRCFSYRSFRTISMSFIWLFSTVFPIGAEQFTWSLSFLRFLGTLSVGEGLN